MDDYILVTKDGNKKWELEHEDNGDILVCSLQDQFGENCKALSYVNPKTKNFRGVRVRGGVFIPPKDGWGGPTGDRVYWITAPTEPLVVSDTSNLDNTSDGKC